MRHITSIYFNNVRFTSNTPGINNAHRGVHLYGQANVSITSCIFEYGKYGIFAYQTYGGEPLNLLGCTFRHNMFGVRTYDKGLGLYMCNFFNNSWGVFSSMMSFPSLFYQGLTGGNITNANETGIKWQGFSTTSLTLEDPYVNTNYVGVRIDNCPLSVKCGSISYNNEGIVFAYGANLFMDDQVLTPNTAANVSVFNNNTSIRTAKGWYLWLNNGYNNLAPAIANDQRTVRGNLMSPPYGITSNSNMWNGFGTLSTADYDLGPHYPIDGNIQTSIAGCGQAIPACPNPPCPNQSPIEYCPSCDVINTDDFSGVKLNIATKDALAILNSNLPDKYKNAVNLFYQILNEQYINPDDKEKYLLSLNYVKMMEALGNAYKYRELACSSEGLPETVSNVMSIQDQLIAIAITNNNLDLRFKYNMDKAQTYRLACKRKDCLDVLNHMDEWVTGDDEISAVNLFKCEVGTEIQALRGDFSPQDVEEVLTNCGGNERRRNTEETEILNKPVSEFTTEIFNFSNFGYFEIKTGTENVHYDLMNSIGEKISFGDANYEFTIDVHNLNRGIYILNVVNSKTGEKSVNKIVID